jgi:hypothetical protein
MGIGRTIGILIGSLFFAGLLWAYVHLSTRYETELDLPLRIVPPAQLAVTSRLPEKIHTRVSAAGWQILLMGITGEPRFQVDLSTREAREPGANRFILRADDLSHAAMLPTEMRVVKVEPDSVEIECEPAAEKRVAIIPRLDVRPAAGYALVGTPTAKPQYVLVRGAANVLANLQYLPTTTFSARSVKRGMTELVEIADTLQNQVQILANKLVQIHFDVQAVGERVFPNIPVRVESLPPDKDLLLYPSSVTITIRGGVEDLARLMPENVKPYVNFDAVFFDTAEVVSVKVDLPPDMTFLSSEPSELKFVVRKK